MKSVLYLQRKGAFIEEIEAEERRKALLATSGPMTLTALIAHQKEQGKTDLVYVNVGSLETNDVFVSNRQLNYKKNNIDRYFLSSFHITLIY